MFTATAKSIQETARRLLLVSPFTIAASLAFAAGADGVQDDLIELSLEELMNVEVTSVSRRSQSLSTAPAAAFVISEQDIRRSGATTIPDALRMVPGVNVAQIDGNKWAVTARGFNGRYAAKLLVLIDGRTVYTPLFSGVFWDIQDISLETIDRIEVIRGPGATLWGANAVNGVINIITKSASETRGGFANAGIGSGGGNEVAFRYGAPISEKTDYRVFAKYHDRVGNRDVSGNPTADDWQSTRLGVRIDHELDSGDSMMIVAEAYDSTMGSTLYETTLSPPYVSIVDAKEEANGYYAQFAWNKTNDNGSAIGLQMYYDHIERNAYLFDRLTVDTVDIDFQQSIRLADRHEFMWGLGYRYSEDEMDPGFSLALDPTSASQRWASAFIQDEIELHPGSVFLTLGTKFESNSFSQEDIEIEPNVRLRWQTSDTQTLWASVSRAVRIPSRGDLGARIISGVIPPLVPPNSAPVPVSLNLYGNPEYKSEELIAFELGYRSSPTDYLNIDIATFYHEHDDERSIVPGAPMCMPSGIPTFADPLCVLAAQYIESPLFISNSESYESYGVEAVVDWTPANGWRLQAAFSTLRIHEDQPPMQSPFPNQIVQESPDFQASLRSLMNLGPRTEFDAWVRYVDELEESGVDAYVTADLRIAWSLNDELQIAVVGKNLLDESHLEFISELGDVVPVEIERRAFVEIRWSF